MKQDNTHMNQLDESSAMAGREHGAAGMTAAAAQDDFSPFTLIPGAHDGGLVLLCDHASNFIPPDYDNLGLAESELCRHIAWDIGAARVTRLMARKLGVPAVLTNFSRLLIDPNRAEDDPTLIMQLSDGAIIPGNRQISPQERQRRLDLFYRPYHRAIDKVIDHCVKAGRPPALLSIHSFTQEFHGALRPWEAAILWDRDDRLVAPLLNCLRRETDFNIGDNEPYSGRLEGDTMHRHGTLRGLAHALVEIRQDQIRDRDGQAQWAGRLADIMSRLLGESDLAAELSRIRC